MIRFLLFLNALEAVLVDVREMDNDQAVQLKPGDNVELAKEFFMLRLISHVAATKASVLTCLGTFDGPRRGSVTTWTPFSSVLKLC